MSATPATLNGLRVTRVRLFHLWKGAWVADCELDVDTPAQAPLSGAATLVAGGVTMTGTVDPRSSGTFASKASVRVVAGAGAWDSVVPREDFANSTGVPSTTVYQATGKAVGETVVDLAPVTFGPHFVRYAGAASLVFGLSDWWVDVTGVTNVGPRPPATPDASLTIRDFDAGEQAIKFSCDTLLYPGTALVDPRFNGATPIVRDVEQVFDETGSWGTAWCAAQPVSRLLVALTTAIRQLGGTVFLRGQRYRYVILQNGGLSLQAVNAAQGMPDLVPVSQWWGIPGYTATLKPSQGVFVGLDFTDPANPQPIPFSYQQGAIPMDASLDALESLALGPSSGSVSLGPPGEAEPLVQAPAYGLLLGALATFAGAVGSAVTPAQIAAAGATLATTLGGLPSAATEVTIAA